MRFPTPSPVTVGRAAAGAGAAVLLVCAGCSSSSSGSGSPTRTPNPSASATGSQPPSDPAAVAAVKGAYAKTVAAKTAKLGLQTQASGGHSGKAQGSGVVGFAGKTSRITVSSAGQSIESRLVHGVSYAKLPVQTRAQLGSTKAWLKVSPAELAKVGGAAAVSAAGNNDPAQSLPYLQGVTAASSTGKKTIRGTSTTGYTATIDLAKVAAAKPALAPAIKAQEQSTGQKTATLEVWLDGQGRARELRSTQKTAGQSAQGASPAPPTTSTTTVDLYDFGVKVSVSPPPAGQTMSLTQYEKQLKAAMSKSRPQPGGSGGATGSASPGGSAGH